MFYLYKFSLQKPYGCQVVGCFKKYTDPSSLRKHVKNHSHEEQLQIKKKSQEEGMLSNVAVKKMLDPSRQKAIKTEHTYNSKTDHTYSNLTHQSMHLTKYLSMNVKQDLKNKIEKNKIRRTMFWSFFLIDLMLKVFYCRLIECTWKPTYIVGTNSFCDI